MICEGWTLYLEIRERLLVKIFFIFRFGWMCGDIGSYEMVVWVCFVRVFMVWRVRGFSLVCWGCRWVVYEVVIGYWVCFVFWG